MGKIESFGQFPSQQVNGDMFLGVPAQLDKNDQTMSRHNGDEYKFNRDRP